MTFNVLAIEVGTVWTVYVCVVTAMIGLVMGSFLNCYGIRICNGESISRGRSHCMSCGHQLSVKDLVPLFSWLSTGGKCRYCGEKVSIRYPLSELATATVYVSLVIKYGLTPECIEMILLFSCALLAAFADITDYLIPDRCIIAGIAIRIVYIAVEVLDPMSPDRFFYGSAKDTFLAMGTQTIVGGLSIALPLLLLVLVGEKVMDKELMGGGDIKLLFMFGLYFYWMLNLLSLLIACLLGIIGGIALNRKGIEHIPWGPYIVGATWITALFGYTILGAYISLFN